MPHFFHEPFLQEVCKNSCPGGAGKVDTTEYYFRFCAKALAVGHQSLSNPVVIIFSSLFGGGGADLNQKMFANNCCIVSSGEPMTYGMGDTSLKS